MGQYWMVINLDKRQHLGHWGKLGEFFCGGGNELVNYLAVPSLTPGSPHPTSRPYGYRATSGWAGDRIICVGDYGQDVPEGILNDDEAREFALLTQREMRRETNSDDSEEEEEQEEQEEEQEEEQYDAKLINLYNVAVEFFERLREKSFSKKGFSQDKVYVLRNLTKREYVRHDAVLVHRDEFDGPFLAESAWWHRPGFAEVLLSRISWSSDWSTSMRYDYEGVGVARGVWAGDRFDIQTIDSIENESGDAGQWKDVSKEVAEKVFEIWTAENGETCDWKEEGRGNE